MKEAITILSDLPSYSNIAIDPKYVDYQVLGYLGECEIQFRVEETVVLCAGLNRSAVLYNHSPHMRFYIDDRIFGESDRPCRMSDDIFLDKGTYTFRCKCIEPVRLRSIIDPLFHVVIAYKPITVRTPATRKNSLFVSAAAFDNSTERTTQLYRQTAKLHDVPYELYDTGKRFQSYYQHKIANLYERFQRWRDKGIEYIFATDCRDVIFRSPIDVILAKFNAMYDGRIITGRDELGTMHPFHTSNSHMHWVFSAWQYRVNSRWCEINTGMIAGHLDDLQKVHENLFAIRAEYEKQHARHDIFDRIFREYRHRQGSQQCRYNIENDDQALHLLNFYDHPEWYNVDGEKKLTTFILNRPPNYKMVSGGYEISNSLCAAPIIHASRPASAGYWHEIVAEIQRNLE